MAGVYGKVRLRVVRRSRYNERVPALALNLTETLSGKPRVSYEEFLALTDSMHVEWVDGEVVPMMAIGFPHNSRCATRVLRTPAA